MKNKKDEEFGISRRNFLKTSAAVGAAVTLSGSPGHFSGGQIQKNGQRTL